MAAVRGSVSRAAAVARHLSTKAAPAESFIDRVKRLGANAMLGTFVSTGVRFDRVLEGLEVTRIDSDLGEVECVFPVTDASSNAYGTLHGGCVTTLVDVVGTMALLSQDPLRAGVSVELSTSFTAAAKSGDSVRCVGRVTKMGRKLGFTQVDLYRVSDGTLAASGRHTKAL